MRRSTACLLAVVLVLVAGCGDDDEPPVGGTDSGTPEGDGGGLDGGGVREDARPMDAPGTDATMPPEDGGIAIDAPPDTGPDPVPVLCDPDPSVSDATLARNALRILGSSAAGATRARCSECHTLTRSRIRYWRALTDTARTNCISGPLGSDADASAMLGCLEDPEATAITTERLGIFATAADLEWFRYVFRHGTMGDWAAAHAAFVTDAGMPAPGAADPALTQDEFNTVCDWFERGLPQLDDVIPSDPLPTTCLPGVSSDVVDHVDAMATTGWSAVNAAAGMLMHGCAGAASPAACLAGEPLASTTAFGTDWEDVGADGVPGAHLRVLFTTTYASAWWTRSSPDGRYVAHGAARSPNLRFIDLMSDTVIGGAADYDPDFFPDASGFMVQGGAGPRICEMRVLTTGMPTMLDFTEPGCAAGTGVGLYEHVGAALSGGDYWAIHSNGDGSEYDNGGQSVTTSDPAADYTSRAAVIFTFFTNDGTRFVRSGTTSVTTPFEGDHVISPSLNMLLTRIAGPGDVPLGYVLRRIEQSGSGGGRTIELPEVGRYCLRGAKPSFSYDERWMATHHYIGDDDAVELGFTGPGDPGFAPYRMRGGANVYLVDLRNGTRYRVTNMGPGQYALFPHFRSDGWMYITVRTESATPEHIIASDAALLAP